MHNFGKRIQSRRKSLNIRQLELAEKLDISPNHLSTLETGKSKPSYELLCRLCDELEVTPDYLMMGNMHSDNLSKNITDKLRQCSEEDMILLDQIIDLLINRHTVL
ncbi:MAG: helix-turn-helix domain-containing protein [Roseburia sp.]|nr:helix-turn-helix domain-containing protein [Roseburia sp.]